MEIDPYLSPCTKLKSNCIKELKIKPDTLNLMEENVGKNLELIGTRKNFLNRTPMSQALWPTVDKWDLRKLKSFCKTKDLVNRTKWQLTSNRVLTSNIYKELKKLDPKAQITQFKNGI
jgi:superfamily II DNA/RNA helicase